MRKKYLHNLKAYNFELLLIAESPSRAFHNNNFSFFENIKNMLPACFITLLNNNKFK